MNKCSPILWKNIAEGGEIPLLLVRHGRTSGNVERRFVGRLDLPLDPHGCKEADLWGERMRRETIGALYSSTLCRAQQTAERLGKPKLLSSLQELDQGELEGLRFEDLDPALLEFLQAWKKGPTTLCVPGGESLGACRDRVIEGLTTVLRTHQPGPPVVVVTHQMVMAAVVLTAVGLPLRFVHLVKHGNTAMDLLAWSEKGGFRVVQLDDREHLASMNSGP
jgi:broad specificity phosphatase PhoE